MKKPKSYKSKPKKPTAAVRSKRRQRTAWSEAEMRQLARLYPKNSNQDIANRMERSLSSVISQAFKMGLKKDPQRLVQMGKENIAHRWQAKSKGRRKK